MMFSRKVGGLKSGQMKRIIRDARFLASGSRLIWAEVLVCLAFPVSIWSVIALKDCTDAAPRYVSLALQIIGFWLIVRDLVARSRDHGRPGYFGKFKAWWSRRPWKPITATMNATAEGDTLFATGRLKQGRAPSQTVEQRVARLEADADRLDDRVSTLDERVEAHKRDIDRQFRSERQARQAEVHGLQERLTETAAGGIEIGWSGLMLAASGALLSTAAPEIARMFGPAATACIP